MPLSGWDGSGTLDGKALAQPAKSAKKKNATPSISSFFKPAVKKNDAPVPSLQEKSDAVEVAPVIPVTPYSVWISETMLQQTRVSAVIPFYNKWMASFPTVAHVAEASEDKINAHWAGLGFYRRARYLHEGAKYAVEKFKNGEGEIVFPSSLEELQKVPGIGPYTAGAIASICFGVRTPAVDGNVLRVLSRLTGVATHVKGKYAGPFSQKLAEELYADGVCPADVPSGVMNQAIMELGATYCQTKGTGMDEKDPLRDHYLTTRLAGDIWDFVKGGGNPEELRKIAEKCTCEICGEVEGEGGTLGFLNGVIESINKGLPLETVKVNAHLSLPMDPPKKGKRDEIHNVLVLKRSSDGKFLMGRRPDKGLLAKQWEFPSVVSAVKTAKEGGGKDKTFTQSNYAEHELQEVLQNFVGGLLRGNVGELSLPKKITPDAGLVHVFSHIRHFMAVDFQTTNVSPGESDDVDAPPVVVGGEQKGKLELSSHTAYRWVSREEMGNVGVTSSITKVLKLLDTSEKRNNKKKNKKTEEGEKATKAAKKPKVEENKLLKMVALDMDGTLLNNDHVLSEASKAKLRELSDLGVKICLATGRSGPAVYEHINALQLKVDVPAVVYNGGMLLNFVAGEEASKALPSATFPVPVSTVDQVLQFAKREGLLVQYYTHDTITVDPRDETHRAFIERYAKLTGATHTIVEDEYAGVKEREGALKLLVMTDEPDSLKERLQKELPADTTLVRGSPPFFVEVLAPNVCKGGSLGKLCKKIGIDMEDTVAFGDGDNDIDMIRDVGYGIAMANGRDVVKKVAKRVTEFTNDEDGVAKMLSILQEEGVFPGSNNS